MSETRLLLGNEMKNHIKVSLILSAVALLGAGIYFAKKPSQKTIHLFLESPFISDTARQSVPAMEALLTTKNVNVKINLVQKRLIDAATEGMRLDAGVSNVGQIFRIISMNVNVTPVMAISPDPTNECIAETQVDVLKNSPIKTLKQLQGKTIGTTKRAQRTMYYIFPELTEMGLKFKKIYNAQEPNWILENLRNKTIDAAIIHHTYIVDKPKAKSDLGQLALGVYEDPDINVRSIKVTDFKIPCRLLFIDRGLDQALQREFLNNFKDILSKQENMTLFNEVAQIGSMVPLSDEEISRMRKFIEGSANISLRSFTENVESTEMKRAFN